MTASGSAGGVHDAGAGSFVALPSWMPPRSVAFLAPPTVRYLLAQPGGPGLIHLSPGPGTERHEVRMGAMPMHVVVLSLRVENIAVEGRLAGEVHRYVRRNGQHMVLPAGADSIWTSAPRQLRDETLSFCYPATWLEEAAMAHGFRPGASALAPRFAQRDPVLQQLATHAASLRGEGYDGAEAYEHIAAMAALRLLGEPSTAETPVGALSPQRLRRVLEHIEAHLEETLRLEDLAATAGLSMFHFARAFRQTVGAPPHAHIRARRVARAQEMLRGRNAALADIALACGFADQSHFTTAFRKATGTTPRRWRAGQH